MTLEIPKKLEKDIKSFCEINNVEDIENFLISCLSKGFAIVKFGETPKDNFKSENKPLKIEKYDSKEKINSERVEEKEAEGGKGAGAKEEKRVRRMPLWAGISLHRILLKEDTGRSG